MCPTMTADTALDCVPGQHYRRHAIGKDEQGKPVRMQIGGAWTPLGIFVHVHHGQHLIAFQDVETGTHKEICGLAHWCDNFVRIVIEPPAEGKAIVVKEGAGY